MLPARLRTLAAVVAGVHPIALIGLAMWWIGEATWPTAFAFDPGGDSDPTHLAPITWLIGSLLVVVAGALIASLVALSSGQHWTQWFVVAWLVAAIVIVGLALGGDPSRRCAFDDYTQVEVCASRTAATVRDAVVFGLPAVVALICILWAVWLDRDRR